MHCIIADASCEVKAVAVKPITTATPAYTTMAKSLVVVVDPISFVVILSNIRMGSL
jgi:hypothetical protein